MTTQQYVKIVESSIPFRMSKVKEDSTPAIRALPGQVQAMSLKLVALQSQIVELSTELENMTLVLGKVHGLGSDAAQKLEAAKKTLSSCKADL